MAEQDKKPSIFQKMLDVGSVYLDAQLAKARNTLQEEQGDFIFGKAVTRDRNYYLGSQGFQEKPGALTFEYLKQMAIKSSVVTAIVKTRQNRVAGHSQYVPEGNSIGFKIVLKNEQEALEEIKQELFGPQEGDEQLDAQGAGEGDIEEKLSDAGDEIAKAVLDAGAMGALASQDPAQLNPEALSEEEKDRQTKKELEKRTKAKKDSIAQFLLHCGELEERPFDSKKWSFDALLRSLTWDSMVYDQIAIELVPKNAEKLKGRLNLHHIQPVDGSTVRFASQELSKYKTSDFSLTQDILYPEDELKALEERDALQLDEGRLENNEYKYVQLIRGRIQRAFTEDELKVGMRNPTADIYTNGYSISELELLVALVTSHLQTEFYNRSYFQQGFSAKGILHVKANLNRSKLEELKRHWNHMVKGNRNSFQTPIMAGMDEVQWIPLTQNHNEMEFTMWLNYLIRMICAIYQIDPSEIGYGMKDEGRSGGGMSGDNTKEKLKESKDKGLIPLMKFFQDFLNKNVVDNLDPDYMLEWTSLEDESEMERIKRQSEEVKFKKSVNEIRAEDGLPPIKGADHLILDPTYMQWFTTMSEEGKRSQQEQQAQQMNQMQKQGEMDQKNQPQQQEESGPSAQEEWGANEASAENDHMRGIESKLLDHQNSMEMEKMKANQKPAIKKSKPLAKSIKVEYYKLEK